MKKVISILLCALMAVALIGGTVSSLSATYTSTLSVSAGYMAIFSGANLGLGVSGITFSTATSRNTNIASCSVYNSYNGNYIYVTGIAAGTAYIDWTGTESGWPTSGTITVTVKDASSSTTGNVTIAVGATDVFDGLYIPTGYESANAIVSGTGVVSMQILNNKMYLTGLKAGTATVYYYGYLNSGSTITVGTLTVTVTASGSSSTTADLTLQVGKSDILSNKYVYTASSSSSAIASVSVYNGVLTVTGLSAGYATISYTSATGSGNFTVQVTSASSTNSVSLAVGGTYPITITNTDAYSSDSSIAKVSRTSSTVTITGVKAGTCTVLIGVNGSYTQYTVTVTASSSSGTTTTTGRLTLGTSTNKTLSATKGKSYALSAVVLDGTTLKYADNGYSRVLWISSNTSVITVDSSGKFKAVGVGTANLIAVTKEGDAIAKCAITVSN